jgi:glyoxylase-like metal-dependent hydrolase (beta-lactamase superfamily II)
MTKEFASTADTAEKKVTFARLGTGLYAFTAEGDPNSGIIVGDDSVMVIDAQATPVMAQEVIERIAKVTDKPIKYVLLSHYHAVRVLGASAYRGAEILASDTTRGLIVERGKQDMESEIARFPRLFRAVETVPGLTWPSVTFETEMSIWLGTREVRIMHIGRGHTAGDVIALVPDAGVVFSGDLVEYRSACYCGDAHFNEWPGTLDRLAELKPAALVPGRDPRLQPRNRLPRASRSPATSCRRFMVRSPRASPKAGRSRRRSLPPAKSWIPNIVPLRSTSIACPLTSLAPMMRPAASSGR